MLPRKLDLAAVSKYAPQLAGDEAYRRFCRPDLSHHRSPQQRVLETRARVHLKKATWFQVPSRVGPLQAYEFGAEGAPNGRSVLLMHGWTSEAAFMAAFVEPLRQKGFRVVAFDLPAHGFSKQRQASLIDCTHAFHAVSQFAGPFHDVVTHSLGGLIALMVADGAPPISGPIVSERYVLIATPNRLRQFSRDFGRHQGLTPAAYECFRKHLRRVGRRPLDSVVTARYLAETGRPALVIHSKDDQRVAFSNAEAIVAGNRQARLEAFDGFGHAGVIFAPPVLRAVRRYLEQDLELVSNF